MIEIGKNLLDVLELLLLASVAIACLWFVFKD